MVITHNIPALSTHMSLKRTDRILAAATKRLSTGYRINSAKDDSAGMAISNKLSYQIGGLYKASENSTNGISMVQTAEGALNEVHNMLQRMRELAVQAANDTMMPDDRAKVQVEINELVDEINKTANRTEFNKIKLLNGEANRVSAGFKQDIATSNWERDYNIANILYLSDNMPAGTLNYTITNPGVPALVQGASPMTPGTGGQIIINGIDVKIDSGDSADTIMTKLNGACEYAGINLYRDNTSDTLYMTTKVAGSNQYIDIKGDAALIAALGFTEGKTPGTDAEIDNITLTDINGIPLAGFNSTQSYVADGNFVTITGADGQIVKLGIQVETVVSATGVPSFSCGNVNTDSYPAAGQNMQIDIKDYGPIKLQIGPNYNMAITMQIPRVTAETMNFVEFTGGVMHRILNYQTVHGATLALGKVDDGIQFVSAVRSKLGAYQNRLESTVAGLDVAAENTEASRSRIRDTDMAREMTIYSQQNVMYQAAMAILGQANQRPQQVVSLLQ